jgi:uncharacterized protein
MKRIIERAGQAVSRALDGDGTGHDAWHIRRVRRLAERIARTEARADRTVVVLGALLHDLADWKFRGGDEEAAPREAGRLLRRLGAPEDIVRRVQDVCREVSFKGAGVKDRPTSLEARIVQDADRLDAIGAIGVARTFAYGGAKGRPMHDPDDAPRLHRSFAAYKRSKGPTINHFHEKLLLLKDRLHTREAKRIAAGRHRYMVDFLRRFLAEWDGRD